MESLAECKTCGTGKSGCNSVMHGLLDHCNKLTVFDWMSYSAMSGSENSVWIEVRFKNTRKDFFINAYNLPLHVGDMVVVEGNPGKDLGMVTMAGPLTEIQMEKKGITISADSARKVLRKAREQDIELWKKARAREDETLLEARKIVRDLNLEMKLSDVEYQGDNTKAIFYYIADQRVDFRELIKIYAQRFSIRVEMKQIGTRQEAARVGGIGSCGRELCCSSWLTDFRTVSTSAARYQQLSLNPQKLAGQCGKLKCCLNFELDHYVESLREFPQLDKKLLKFKEAELVWFKNDIFKKLMWFFDKKNPYLQYAIPLEEVVKVIEQNKIGIFPEDIPTRLSTASAIEDADNNATDEIQNVLEEENKESLNQRLQSLKKRFQKSKPHKKKHNPSKRK